MKAAFIRASRRSPGFSWLAAGFAFILAMTVLIGTQSSARAAQAQVSLGTASNFAVLAGTTVTNTGSSTITGNLGVSPGTAVTGFPPGTVIGEQHSADAFAAQAQSDVTTAYNDAAGRTPVSTVPTELGGTTRFPGVYDSAAGTFGITGTLTLDAQGDPNAVFIFKMASTLTTASGSRVNLIGGARACHVFWQVGSSATLGTNSTFVGNILALTSITVTTGATIDGRALARNGAVTLDTNTINRANCAPPVNTGVDGFPFLFNESGSNGGSKIWVIGHHGYVPPTAPKISCTDAATGTPCPDKNGSKTWPMPLNTGALPLDTTTAGDISTTEAPMFVLDPVSNQKLYYPAVTKTAFPGFSNGSVGVGCVNLQTQVTCAYTPLAGLTNTPGQSNVNGLAGLVLAGSNLYGTTTSGQELCFNTTSGSACTGQPYASSTPPSLDVAGLAPNNFMGTMAVIGGNVYTASNGADPTQTTRPHAPTLTCFDPGTKAPCAGWGTKVLNSAADAYIATAIFPDYNAAGTAVGVCGAVGRASTAAPTVACYDFTGATLTPPSTLAALFPSNGMGSVIFAPLTLDFSGKRRTYFPFYSQDSFYPGNTVCYDWSLQSACQGFPNPAGHPGVHGGDTRDYGYIGSTSCVYGTGDRRYLFSFNPATGASEC
jgi:hypothetical protein